MAVGRIVTGRHAETPVHSPSMTPAAELDRADPLARFRQSFQLPTGRVYLDGNSLGPCSRSAEAALLQRVTQWKSDGVEAWRDWIDLPQQLAARVARLIGAQTECVAVCGSTTSNLHQLLSTVYTPTLGRSKIVIDASAFPSDAHAVQSHLRLRGLSPEEHLMAVPPRGDGLLREEDLIAAIDPTVALLLVPAVVYTTGQLLDLARLAKAAHERGAMIGIDCAHSIGAVPHALDAIDADFAFWCSYKYLNAGPGAVGGLYLNARHFDRPVGLAGWFGNRRETMFAMRHEFEPAGDASALMVGTPHILSLAPLEGSLSIIEQAGLDRMRTKSLAMTDRLIALADERLAKFGVRVVTPREHDRRGGHVALSHPEAHAISIALRDRGVVPDFRPPDILRLAPAPLYNTFAEVDAAVDAIDAIFDEGGPREPASKETVT
jgi:kynureninase